MSELKGPPAELHFTLTIKRKETGKVETFDMVGRQIPEPETQQPDASLESPERV